MILASDVNRPCRRGRSANDRSMRRVAQQPLRCPPPEIDRTLRLRAAASADSLQGGLQPVGRRFRVVASLAMPLPCLMCRMNSKRVRFERQADNGRPRRRLACRCRARPGGCPAGAGARPPGDAAVRHGARRCYAGCGWWRALIEQARAAHPGIPIDDILDCADAPGLRARRAAHRPAPDRAGPAAAAGWSAVAAVAASLGGEVLTSRPPALDMAERDAARRLHDWLRTRTTPGDSGGALG